MCDTFGDEFIWFWYEDWTVVVLAYGVVREENAFAGYRHPDKLDRASVRLCHPQSLTFVKEAFVFTFTYLQL